MSDTILLVDRERNRGRLLAKRLRRLGYTVTPVASVEEALDADMLPPRVLIIDLAELCGADRALVENLLAQEPRGPVLECPRCGRRLRELVPGAGTLVCCGVPLRTVRPARVEPVER